MGLHLLLTAVVFAGLWFFSCWMTEDFSADDTPAPFGFLIVVGFFGAIVFTAAGLLALAWW